MERLYCGLTFKEVFTSYYSSLLGFTKSLVKDDAVAEDIVQESFYKFYEKDLKFNEEVSLCAYLYTICRNLSLNHLQRNKTDRIEVELPDEETILNKIVKEEVIKALHLAIEELPERDAQILKMSLKGCTNQEIADFNKMSLDAVKKRKTLLYKKLRKVLIYIIHVGGA